MLHELLAATMAPHLEYLPSVPASTISDVLRELKDKVSLSWSGNLQTASAAEVAAQRGHGACFKFLAQIGGAQAFWSKVASEPSRIEHHPWLLGDPGFLNLAAKRSWLRQKLRTVVADADDVALSLVARRDNLLDGLCANLGVDEAQADLSKGARRRALVP